jgi:hypothetical protein
MLGREVDGARWPAGAESQVGTCPFGISILIWDATQRSYATGTSPRIKTFTDHEVTGYDSAAAAACPPSFFEESSNLFYTK